MKAPNRSREPRVPGAPGVRQIVDLRSRYTRPLDPEAPVLGKLGSLEVRLARNRAEIRAAQTLRFNVFYEEMSAVADADTLLTRRDKDAYDPACDHLLVVDTDKPADSSIVATYRLLPQPIAELAGGFYTASEFDIEPMLARHTDLNFLELGRSCVLADYRNKRTMELLWHGLWLYIQHNDIDVMMGCASLEGTDPEQLALPLSFLFHHARADGDWQTRAVPERACSMDRIAKDDIEARSALRTLPPLVKGYLRLGAMFGEEAVIDHQFGTTDVLIILPVSNLNERYVSYYGGHSAHNS
ncbi:MAG: GNAT family N-acetyltransferase [Pseudomonadota bacterium]